MINRNIFISLLAGYFLSFWAGFQFDFYRAGVSQVWVPTGFTVAAVACFGFRAVPCCGLSAFVSNFLFTESLKFSLISTASNTFEAILCWLLLKILVDSFECSLHRIRDVIAFSGIGFVLVPLGGTLVGGVAMTGALNVSADEFQSSLQAWWLGNFIGAVVFAPAFLVLLQALKLEKKFDVMRVIPIVLLVLLALNALFQLSPLPDQVVLVLAMLPFPLLIFLSLKYRIPGASMGLLLISLTQIGLAITGSGPFFRMQPADALLYAAIFLLFVTVTTLSLGSVSEERLEVEARNRRQTELIMKVFDALPGAVWRLNRANELQWANQRAQTLAETSLSQMKGKHILSVWPAEKSAIIENLPKASEQSWQDTFRMNGDRCGVYLTSSVEFVDPVSLQPGRLLLSMDISARAEAEKRFYLLFEQSEAAHLIVSDQGHIRLGNQAAARILALSHTEQLKGVKLIDWSPSYQPNGTRSEETDGYMASLRFGTSKRFEWVHVNSRGERVPVEAMTTPMQWDGELALLVVWNDLATIKINEEVLRRARDDADKANRAKSEFLGMMSHEMRTPLNGILGFAHLMAEQNDLAEQERQEYLEVIQNSARGLLSVINELLDYSQIESGRLRMKLGTFDPERMLSEVLATFEGRFEQKGVELQLDYDLQIPGRITGDRDRVRQVLNALVSNALKFTDKGTVRVRVQLRTEQKASWIRYEIEDTGIGIAPENHSQVFTRFFQEDSAVARKYEGLGIGLAVSRNLVEMMQGRIGFESAKHQGTLFWFELPLDDSVIEESLEEEETDWVFEGSPKILVVESEPELRTRMLRWLEQLGCEAESCDNGAEAVVRIQAGGWNLVLMGFFLNELNGCETTRIVRQLKTDMAATPIIVLNQETGDVSDEALQAGVSEILDPPFVRSKLRQVLLRHLELKPAPEYGPNLGSH